MIGSTLGHYRVLEKLGEGGMGVVYKAQDLHLDRLVALKVLPAEKVADPQRKARFIQEAKAASALNHPHIVHVYDTDQAEGVDFIAMEYVAGRTLDQVIPRHGMRLPEALKLAAQLADALARAHAARIVHRDLKPGNVMVSAEGQAKVLDFGLAKLTEAEPLTDNEPTRTLKPVTEQGTIVGTVAYMSPEQAEGKAVDARSDIFSFGAVLYEMLTGRQAFAEESKTSTLGAIIHKEPAPLGPEVPAPLSRIIGRCLRKDPERRFQHMKDLKVELEELKEESASGALAAVAAPKSVRRGAGAALAVVALVAVVAAAGWLWLGRAPTTAPEAPLTAVPLTSLVGQEASPSFSPDGNQVVFAWDGEKQDNFDIYIRTVGAGDPLRRTTDAADDFSPAWSPDGKQVAFLRNLGSNRLAVMLMPPVSGAEQKLSEIQGGVGNYSGQHTLAWHPDGTHLAVSDAGALWLLSTETRDKQSLTTPPPGRPDRNPAFSADGRRLVFARGSVYASDLYLLALDADLAPQGDPRALTTGLGSTAHPVWTPDDREIVFSAGSPQWAARLWRMTVAGPGAPRLMTSAGEAAFQPAISRERRRLAYARLVYDTSIYRLDVSGGEATGRRPVRHIASSRVEGNPRFSPDGTKVAFESDQSGFTEIWVCNSDGSNLVQVTKMGGPHTGSARWSPDGEQIVFDSRPQGQSDIFVVAASGGKPRQLTTNSASDQIPSWSRDGKWIYFTSNRSGRAEVWKTPAPAGGTSVPEDPQPVTQNGGSYPFESADGRFVYYARGGSVWRMPVEGGEESRVVESASQYFALAANGLYFIQPGEGSIRYLDLTTKATHTVAVLDPPPFWGFTVSPDGRTLLFTLVDNYDTDLMLVEHFR
jgi:Tol biopolymer transport system component/predicted Ser/Thr protein kinase